MATTRPLTHPPQPANAIRKRSILVCVAVALILGGLSLLGAPVMLGQILEMVPPNDGENPQSRLAIVEGALQAQRTGLIVNHALNAVHRRTVGLRTDRLAELDPGNGLYAQLQLLDKLRHSAATTAPADDIQRAIRDAAHAPPVRLYHSAVERAVRDAMLRTGLNPRAAGVEGLRTLAMYQRPQSRRVFRELSQRLEELAAKLRGSAQLDAALAADTLHIRVMLDLLADSPTYSVALLCSERLPGALRSAAESATDADRTALARQAADQAARLRTDWHAAATSEVNVLPFSGNIVADIAYPDGRAMLTAFTRTAILMASYVLLLTIIVVLAVVSALPGARRVPVVWRGNFGPLLAVAIVLLPLALLMLITGSSRFSYSYLFTLRSGAKFIWFLPVSLFMLALATRAAVRLPETAERARLPVTAALAILAGGALLWIAGTFAVPVRAVATMPPPGTQYFRNHALLGGFICLLSVLTWFIWQQVRRSHAGLPVGVLARTHLPVAAQALVVVAVLLALMVLANSRRDRAHQSAYAAAAQDPIADKLGPDWQHRYFAPARQLFQALQQPAASAPMASRD